MFFIASYPILMLIVILESWMGSFGTSGVHFGTSAVHFGASDNHLGALEGYFGASDAHFGHLFFVFAAGV